MRLQGLHRSQPLFTSKGESFSQIRDRRLAGDGRGACQPTRGGHRSPGFGRRKQFVYIPIADRLRLLPIMRESSQLIAINLLKRIAPMRFVMFSMVKSLFASKFNPFFT
jgi:hypothetical protein